jgi:tetratricopeptide (TPR) repeat protein
VSECKFLIRGASNMTTETELKKLAEDGKLAFEARQYQNAVSMFGNAAQGYASLHDDVNAAEMKNNLSVALLKTGQAQAAFDAARGTEEVFARASDLKRQGMVMGNQAAALEVLKRFDEALVAYERSAQFFAEAGEGDLRSMVLKSAAGIKLKRGQVTDSAFRMIGSLEAKDKPSIFERILKFLLRFVQR